jgi:hypothetical protein
MTFSAFFVFEMTRLASECARLRAGNMRARQRLWSFPTSRPRLTPLRPGMGALHHTPSGASFCPAGLISSLSFISVQRQFNFH